jgi:fibronectin-binding autotransporter adhesin
LALSGTGTYTGETHVDAGTLLVNGDYSNATGTTLVASGASLGGVGTIGGDVSLADSAVLTPGAGGTGTLGINGNLSLSSGTQLNYQFGAANTAGGALNDLVNIGGDLTLDGVINVSMPVGSAFDVGIYRVFNYGGKLTDNGLSLGALPIGSSDIAVQTSISGQVNLVNSAGLTLSLWDGAAGPKNNGIINGGDGVWQASSGNDNWTDSSGAVNAAYSDGAYAVFSATKGIVTVDNGMGAVSAAGMQFASDGYIITGDAVTLIGPQSVIRVGDGQSNSSGFTATINSALLGDTQVVKTDAGTLVLGGNNTYTGGTLIKGGTVQIAADSNLGAVTGGLSFNGGVLRTTADVTSARTADFTDEGTLLTDPDTTLILSGSLSGTGNLKKAGDGMVVLMADSSGYNGSGIVDAGTLAVNGALGGTLSVSGGGHLTGTGQVGATTNYGSISPGFSGEIGTLTIQGDYIGNNGHLDIAAALGDDSSAASRLVVTGAASGTTHVSVTNRGGMGGQTTAGIKIIDVTGASDGRFVLDGDYEFNGDQAVVAGAFGYRLYQGGVSNPADGDWYLRSGLLNPTDPTEPATPLYQPGVPLYETYSQLLGTLDELPTLRQRVGDHYTDLMPATSDDQPGGALFTWVRIIGGHGDFAPKSSATVSGYNADIEQIQGGFSAPVAEMETGRLVIEGTVHMGTTQSEMTSTYGDGAIDVTSYGFGGTVTWYGRDGIYLDGQGQYTGFVTDLYSRLLGYNVATAQKAYSLKAGIETGKVYRLNARWSLTPQAQFVYSTLSMDRFKDRFGAEVSPNQVDNLRGRIGLAVDYRNSWRSNTGRMSSISVYGLPNLYYEFFDPKTTVNISGTTLAYDIGRLSGGLALGVKFDGNDGEYSLYGEISGDTGLDGKGRSHMIKGNFGLRVRW